MLALVDFKGWHHILFFDGTEIAWPRRCACCLGSPASPTETSADGRTIRYPICVACQRHARADDVAAGLSLSTALLVAVIVHLTLFGLKIPTGLGLAGLLLLIVFIGGAAGLRMCVRWMIPKARSCLDRDWPVDFLSTPLSTSHEQGKRHGPQAAPGIRAEGYSGPNARRKAVTCASESNSVRWSRSDVASGDGL